MKAERPKSIHLVFFEEFSKLFVEQRMVFKCMLCELAELTNRLYCSSQREALMNTVVSCNEVYWLERIEHKCLRWL